MLDILDELTYPFGFFAVGYMVHFLLISLYCLILYGLLVCAKRILATKLSIRARYYSWYILLISFPLAGFYWNDIPTLFLLSHYDAGRYKKVLLVAAVVWSINVSCKLVSQFIVSTKVRGIIRKAMPYPDNNSIKNRAGQAVGLKLHTIDNVTIVATEIVRSPVSYGLFKKYILLPLDFSRYSEDEMYLLLLHEMAHIKNRDTTKMHLFGIAQSFMWVLGLFERQFKRDTEILCDNRVIGIQQQARDTYSDLLLKESINTNRVDGIAFTSSYRAISGRINALYSHKPENHRLAAVFILSFATLFLLVGCASAHQAEWFVYNTSYNSDFAVYLNYYDSNSGETSMISAVALLENNMDLQLPADHFNGLWEVDDKEIKIDLISLQEAVEPFFYNNDTELSSVTFSSFNYLIDYDAVYSSPEIGGVYSNSEYDILFDEIETASEDNRYYTSPLQKRGIDEYSLLLMAWLA